MAEATTRQPFNLRTPTGGCVVWWMFFYDTAAYVLAPEDWPLHQMPGPMWLDDLYERLRKYWDTHVEHDSFELGDIEAVRQALTHMGCTIKHETRGRMVYLPGQEPNGKDTTCK